MEPLLGTFHDAITGETTTREIRMSTSGGNGSMNSATSIGVLVVEDIGSV